MCLFLCKGPHKAAISKQLMYLDVTVLLESLNITAILEQAIFNNSHTKGETASGSAIAAYPCLNGKARMPPG